MLRGQRRVRTCYYNTGDDKDKRPAGLVSTRHIYQENMRLGQTIMQATSTVV